MRLLLAFTLLVASTSLAAADLVVTVVETGGDVVWTLSGFADVDDLGAPGGSTFGPGVAATLPFFGFGTPAAGADSYFTGADDFPVFGTAGGGFADTTTGDYFQFQGSGSDLLSFDAGYVSGTALSSTMTYTGETFASLGLTEGVYTTSWGGGDEVGETLTLTIGAVPEPSSTALILASGALVAVVRRRRAAV